MSPPAARLRQRGRFTGRAESANDRAAASAQAGSAKAPLSAEAASVKKPAQARSHSAFMRKNSARKPPMSSSYGQAVNPYTA